MTLSILKSPAQSSCRLFHILDLCYCFLMSRFRLNIFLQDYPIGDVVSFSVHPIRRHVSSACPIIGGAKLGHLAKESLCFNPIPPSSLPPEASSTWSAMHLASSIDRIPTSDHTLEKGDKADTDGALRNSQPPGGWGGIG